MKSLDTCPVFWLYPGVIATLYKYPNLKTPMNTLDTLDTWRYLLRFPYYSLPSIQSIQSIQSIHSIQTIHKKRDSFLFSLLCIK